VTAVNIAASSEAKTYAALGDIFNITLSFQWNRSGHLLLEIILHPGLASPFSKTIFGLGITACL